MEGRARAAVAGGQRGIEEDPVAWVARHEAALAPLHAIPPLDPDVVLGDQVALASQIQAALPDLLPGLDPAQVAALSVAVMPHILRAVDVQARLEERRERRQQAAEAGKLAQALPTATTVEESLSDDDRLRQMAVAIRIEAQMAGMWPGGTVQQLVEDMERQAAGT